MTLKEELADAAVMLLNIQRQMVRGCFNHTCKIEKPAGIGLNDRCHCSKKEFASKLRDIATMIEGGIESAVSNDMYWWGYLHTNGTIQVKRWFGDHKDYREDCEGNEFVKEVVVPFVAYSHEEALERIIKEIGL